LLGYPAATNSIWELEGSACFLIVSSNITEAQNVAAVPIKQAAKRGATLIVIDQRETELTRYAKIWLRPRPGTEAALIGGMLRVILDESLDDHDFLAEHCENVDDLRNALWSFDLIKVEGITGIPIAQIQAAARAFAAAKPAAILYALETVPPEVRGPCSTALVNLALATGNVGRPSTGLFPLFTGANEQGSKDVGCAPDMLPGHHSVSDEKARLRLQQAWNARIPSSSGLELAEITSGIREGRIKALQVIGDSPTFTNGELPGFLEAAKGLDFLLVQDSFSSQLTEIADVVLPATTFARMDGTYTNLERRVQILRPALGPKGDEDPDWRIVCRLASRMDAQGFDYQSSEAIFDEISDLVVTYGGMSHQRLQSGGLQWPCMAADMVDTPILYASGFGEGKARFGEIGLLEAPPEIDAEYPLVLARGRVLQQPQRELEIIGTNGRNGIKRDEIVEIHEDDALATGVSEGDWVEVVTAEDRVQMKAQLSGPQQGMISTTSLFGELILELERSKLPDPMQKVPGIPLVRARLEKSSVTVAAD
jgi:predicted molibdopterin-dependent oxidoreductase YjgC